MTEESLLKDCQNVMDKSQESWKSYFTKWERFAKFEEDIPESELFSEAIEKRKSKKNAGRKQNIRHQLRPSISYKKNQKNRKKLVKKKKTSAGSKQQVIADFNNENSDEKLGNVQIEAVLKTVFMEFLKANKNEFQMLAVFSSPNHSQYFQLSYGSPKQLELAPNHAQFVHHSYDNSKQLTVTPTRNTQDRSICPSRSSYIKNLSMNQNLVQQTKQHLEWKLEQPRNQILNNSFHNYRSNIYNQNLLLHINRCPTLNETPKKNLEIINCNPSNRNEDMKLKSLKWDLSLKSPTSVCRKINKEYFIKRNFLKMNITQDGKRFRNLCLRKRTNSVTLSMENSNFTTPERNPPERKCFSENVLQGKTRRPSKLFFGNEEDDSESDDQTETQPPIIHCKNKKLKTQIISEATESDTDDCGSIFDRVKTLKN